MKSVPLDCMTWKQAAAPMVVNAVASTTVMSMRAGDRRARRNSWMMVAVMADSL